MKPKYGDEVILLLSYFPDFIDVKGKLVIFKFGLQKL